MFTGLVEETGKLLEKTPRPGGLSLRFGGRIVLQDARKGCSIAVNGTCLTAMEFDAASFSIFAVDTTLSLTNLGRLKPGDPVNLERPVTLEKRLGGHLVNGHVDGMAALVKITPQGEGRLHTYEFPPALMKYVIKKGSVALDGVSLTAAEVEKNLVTIALIPETLNVTNMGGSKIGDRINIEVDQIAKYVENFVQYFAAHEKK
jgi:riboflavin synthase